MESDEEDSGAIQQALLDKLMQYGDSLLDTEDYEKRKAEVAKKKKKQKRKVENNSTVSEQFKDSPLSNPKKKSKQLKTAEIDSASSEQQKKRKNKRSGFKEFEEELKSFKESRKSDPVETVEEVREKKPVGPEVIVFDDPAKRKKNKDESASTSTGPEFDLNKARLEVQKFGISGFDYDDRRKFEQERAIKLGAKPPKREYVNYKQLMEQLKEKRAKEQKQKEIDRKLGNKATTSKSSEKDVHKTILRNHGFWKDRSIEKGFHLDGQVGRYRPGVLWLNGKDVAKVKSGSKTKNSNKTGGKSKRTGGNQKR